MFVRIPVALFFTVALPLIIVVLFNLVFGGDEATVETSTGDWSIQQFYVAALAAFEVVSATFTNLANMIPDRRQDGVMKRWRGTPLPSWIYLSGFVGAGLIIAIAGFALIVGIGFAFYDLEIDVAKVPALVVAFIVGTMVFSALGVAVAGLIRNQEAAPAVTNAIILPMAFISNTFIAVDESAMPRWLDVVARGSCRSVRSWRASRRRSTRRSIRRDSSGATSPSSPCGESSASSSPPARSSGNPSPTPTGRLAGDGAARRTRHSERRDSCTAVSPTDPPLPPSPDEPTEEPQWAGGEPGEPPVCGSTGWPDEPEPDGELERAKRAGRAPTQPSPTSHRRRCCRYRRRPDRGAPADG